MHSLFAHTFKRFCYALKLPETATNKVVIYIVVTQ